MTVFTSQDYRTLILLNQEEEFKLRAIVLGFLGGTDDIEKVPSLEEALTVAFGN